MAKTTKEISVFIDESGSFDPDRSSSRSYLVCMVFHEPEGLSESEKVFFGGTKNFKKNYLKLLDRKRFA